ncbi:MAG: helix-turn-helix domain-containing protein [Planctomycetota bacterium]|jgi:excisionase family DNA binding protein
MNTNTHEPPVLITEKETARLLGCCERSVWQLRKDGKIRCVKIGKAVRYARTEIDRFVASQMDQETTTTNENSPE